MIRGPFLLPAAAFAAAAAAVSLPSAASAMANPAATFCVSMGGKVEMATLRSGGEVGLCYLPQGRIIEEWTLFRMYKGKKPTGLGLDRNPFVPPR